MNKLDRSCLLVGGTRELLLGIATGLLVVYLTGCAGGRIYMGYETIDQLQESRSMTKSPWEWHCLLGGCADKEKE